VLLQMSTVNCSQALQYRRAQTPTADPIRDQYSPHRDQTAATMRLDEILVLGGRVLKIRVSRIRMTWLSEAVARSG